MIFQKVLKGIAGITQAHARAMLDGDGIICNWWRDVGLLPESEILDRLTEDDLLHHLTDYDVIDPITLRKFGETTPFISTTAGGVQRDDSTAVNTRFSAFLTALSFATQGYTTRGVIFYGYLNVLGRKSVAMREFAEETRELNIWTDFQPYHSEGEVVAKISIPPTHLEKAECYDGPAALSDLQNLRVPVPQWTLANTARYVPPESICNVRDALL
ncbi:MAG: hypothetical protein ACYC67_25350 [Prosthecobacter sp.]